MSASQQSPEVYAAVKLGSALETAVKKHESGFHHLEGAKSKIHLEGLEETLFIPLLARAKMTREHNSFFSDPKSTELVEQVGYDFAKIDKMISGYLPLIFGARAKQFDDKIRAYITEHPRASVVNIGAGFDTTFYRIDNGTVRWYDLDLPAVIELRKKLIPETDRMQYIAKSLFDQSWCKDIENVENGVFIISCGVLAWFNEVQVKQFFLMLVDNFPDGEIVFDAASKLGTLISNYGLRRMGMKKTTAKWELRDANEMTKWYRRIRVIDQFPCFKNIPREAARGRSTKIWMDFVDKLKMYNVFYIQV